MTIPVDAIDVDAAYEEWQRRWLWHLDQIPGLINVSGILAVPRIKTQKYGPDVERVSGGGYVDNVPIIGGTISRDTVALWGALRTYLTVASSHVGLEAPAVPHTVPEDVDTARRWAYAAIEWLAAVMHLILDWPELTVLEDAMFAIIRRARRHNPGLGTVRRERPGLCSTCGQEGVLVDWIDGPGGVAMLARACRVCGQVYLQEGELR